MDDIKESSTSKKGGTNGSVAGVGSSDLDRGFTDAGVDEFNEFSEGPTFEQQQGGFLKRPGGWER